MVLLLRMRITKSLISEQSSKVLLLFLCSQQLNVPMFGLIDFVKAPTIFFGLFCCNVFAALSGVYDFACLVNVVCGVLSGGSTVKP